MVEKETKVGYAPNQIGCAFVISILIFIALIMIFI